MNDSLYRNAIIKANKTNQHIIAEKLDNGVFVVISPGGSQNNIWGEENLKNFIEKNKK